MDPVECLLQYCGGRAAESSRHVSNVSNASNVDTRRVLKNNFLFCLVQFGYGWSGMGGGVEEVRPLVPLRSGSSRIGQMA